MLRKTALDRLRVEVCTAADQNDVLEVLRAVELRQDGSQRLVGNLPDRRVELPEIVVLLVEPEDSPGPQCGVDGIQVPVVLLDLDADRIGDQKNLFIYFLP